MGRDRGGRERGSVAITVTLAMTVLLGFAALVVDVGLSWAARASAQTAADSAALAGAAELVANGPAAAVGTVRDYLNDNVNGLADSPVDPDWPFNTIESDGEIVCWTLPGDPPAPGANCPPGSNALQVITPPIEVDYAFAPVLGASSNSIKAMAAAAAGPAAPNNCVLCLLEPGLANALAVTSNGGVDVSGGGIVVNSVDGAAVALLGGGDVRANQIRVIGGVLDGPGGGQLIPPAELGGPPVPDPLADLPTPDALAIPPPCCSLPQVVTSDMTLSPGVYESITVLGNNTLTLEPGVYVLTDPPGLSITGNGRVVGTEVTVYLACSGYPTPCDGPGAPFVVAGNGRYDVTSPTSDEYAGLSVFFDRGNTAPMVVDNNTGMNLDGALYAASAPLTQVASPGLRVDGLLVVGTLLLDGNGPVDVNYNPGVLLPGVAPPVLIR